MTETLAAIVDTSGSGRHYQSEVNAPSNNDITTAPDTKSLEIETKVSIDDINMTETTSGAEENRSRAPVEDVSHVHVRGEFVEGSFVEQTKLERNLDSVISHKDSTQQSPSEMPNDMIKDENHSFDDIKNVGLHSEQSGFLGTVKVEPGSIQSEEKTEIAFRSLVRADSRGSSVDESNTKRDHEAIGVDHTTNVKEKDDVTKDDVTFDPGLFTAFRNIGDNLLKFATVLYKCTLCTSLPSIFTSKDSFILHVSQQHLTRHGFFCECPKCRLRFRTEEDLKAHIHYVHSDAASHPLPAGANVSHCVEKDLDTISKKASSTVQGSQGSPGNQGSSGNQGETGTQGETGVVCNTSHCENSTGGEQEKERAARCTELERCNKQQHQEKEQRDNNKYSHTVNNMVSSTYSNGSKYSHGSKTRHASVKNGTTNCTELLDLSKKNHEKGLQVERLQHSSCRRDHADTRPEARTDDRRTTGAFGKHSQEEMARLHRLTDQIVRNNSANIAQEKGFIKGPVFSFTASFTPEFGKFTKLVREGGNIVYFCQVCNWKSPVKSTFHAHCNTSGHKTKVSSADEKGPDAEHEQQPSSACCAAAPRFSSSPVSLSPKPPHHYNTTGETERRDFREPVSWSPRGGASCLSMLVDTPTKFYQDSNNITRHRHDVGTSDCKRTNNVLLPFHTDGMRARVPSATTDATSSLCDMRKTSHSLNEFRSNRRKRSAPTSLRNQIRLKRQWSDSDSESGSSSDKNDLNEVNEDDDYLLQHKKRILEATVDANNGISKNERSDPPNTGKTVSPNSHDQFESRNVLKVNIKTENEDGMLMSDDFKIAPSPPVDDNCESNCSSNKSYKANLRANTSSPVQDPESKNHDDLKQKGNMSNGFSTTQMDPPNVAPFAETKTYKCYFCSFEYTDIASYRGHFERAHSSANVSADNGDDRTTTGSGSGESMYPLEMGENWRVQKLKEVLPDFLVASLKGNISREHLLQRISLTLGIPEIMGWGSACNKAMREAFPSSLAQRKGKYKKTYFFGVNLVEPPLEQEDVTSQSDLDALTYQPLRDMNVDMEKILEYIPNVLQWTGDMDRGVSRDEVLTLLCDRMEDSDVRQWGTQCNRAMRLVFPKVDMKRKGKYKITVFFGVDFQDKYKKNTFIPNKRGRPRKALADEMDPALQHEMTRDQLDSQLRGDPFSLIRKAQARHWLDSIGPFGVYPEAGHHLDNADESQEPYFRSHAGWRNDLPGHDLLLGHPSFQRWFGQEKRVPGFGDYFSRVPGMPVGSYPYVNENDDDGDGDDEDDFYKDNADRSMSVSDDNNDCEEEPGCTASKDTYRSGSPSDENYDKDQNANKNTNTESPQGTESSCKDENVDKNKENDNVNVDKDEIKGKGGNSQDQPQDTCSWKRQHMHAIVETLSGQVS